MTFSIDMRLVHLVRFERKDLGRTARAVRESGAVGGGDMLAGPRVQVSTESLCPED